MWLDDLLKQLEPTTTVPIPPVGAVFHPRSADALQATATSDGPFTTAGRDAPATPAGLAVLAAQAATARPISFPGPPRHARESAADAITGAPPAPPVAGLPSWFPADDRINCTACANFTPPGCQACRNGLFSFRARDHRPDPERLHRCFLYAPLEQDHDQRPGAERWPGLAWQGRAR
jgi:hypothetical protein